MMTKNNLKQVVVATALLLVITLGYCVWSYQSCLAEIGDTDNLGGAVQIVCPGIVPSVGMLLSELFPALLRHLN